MGVNAPSTYESVLLELEILAEIPELSLDFGHLLELLLVQRVLEPGEDRNAHFAVAGTEGHEARRAEEKRQEAGQEQRETGHRSEIQRR